MDANERPVSWKGGLEVKGLRVGGEGESTSFQMVRWFGGEGVAEMKGRCWRRVKLEEWLEGLESEGVTKLE